MPEKLELVSWENAGISNNFIFRLALDDIEICQEQLEILLDVKIAKIDFKEHEKEYEHDKFQKGVRLDIYIQDKDGTAYDLEMQVGENEKEYLPCRTRYYQSKMDGELLAKGKSYRYLKNTIIIFICTKYFLVPTIILLDTGYIKVKLLVSSIKSAYISLEYAILVV